MNTAQQTKPRTGSESCNAMGGGIADKRYTITPEFCGQVNSRFVVRFAGGWVGQADTYDAAATILAYEVRVRLLELEGATRSDAQAVIDAEDNANFMAKYRSNRGA